jgi:hypothetical protein
VAASQDVDDRVRGLEEQIQSSGATASPAGANTSRNWQALNARIER